MLFILAVAVLLPAFVIRACRPGPVPKWRATWFDVAHDANRAARRQA